MAGNNKDSVAAKTSIRLRFRHDVRGLIYSRNPGGEGRIVTETEAVRFVRSFDQEIDKAAVKIKRWVIVSFAMPVPLGIAASVMRSPVLVALALVALVSWIGAFAVLRWQRWRLVQDFWASIERRPAIAALSRSERIGRGLAMGLRDWLILACFLAFLIALKAPIDVFPEPWRASHMTIRGVLLVPCLVALAGLGITRLIGWRRNAN